jgi:hypothetical protein
MRASVLRAQTRSREIAVPALIMLAETAKGLVLEEGLMLAGERKATIASVRTIAIGLMDNDTRLRIKNAFVCRSGTMFANVEPGRSFRESSQQVSSLGNGYFVVYEDPVSKNRYYFPIPEQHLDKRDSILLTEHPDYSLRIDGRDRIVLDARISLVERFPKTDGWFAVEEAHGIATEGEAITSLSRMACLLRGEKMVSAAAIDYGRFPHPDHGRQILNIGPSARLGTIIKG